jgi:hypothetical protein
MQLWADGEGELIGFYWTLLEMIAKYGEQYENLGKWTVNLTTFKLKLGMNSQRSRKLLLKIGQTFEIEVEQKSEQTYQLFARNMTKILDSRVRLKRDICHTLPEEAKKQRSTESKNPRILRPNSTLREPGGSPVTLVKKAFCESYEKEFSRSYTGWGAKEASQAKTWLKSVSLEKACELCRLYPKWNDRWVTERGHPFGLLTTKYVELDSWAHSHEKLIQKIAIGEAVKTNQLKRAIQREDLYAGVRERIKEQENHDDSGSIQGKLPNTAETGFPESSDNPFNESIFDARSKDTDANGAGDT